MPSYSLSLEGRDGEKYVPSHDFPQELHADDTFDYDGATWRVVEVAIKQFDADGEPGQTLRCIPA